jgi:hypothetical protein
MTRYVNDGNELISDVFLGIGGGNDFMEMGGWRWEDGDGEDGNGRMEMGGWK